MKTTVAFIDGVDPSTSRNTGSSAMTGNDRRMSTSSREDCSAAAYVPVTSPSGTPITTAAPNPVTAPRSVSLTACQYSPLPASSGKRAATAAGPGSAVALTSPAAPISAQRARTASTADTWSSRILPRILP